MNKVWVHDDGEPSFALLHDGSFENILVVADRFMISVFKECFKVLGRCLCITQCRCSSCQDSADVAENVRREDWLKLGEYLGGADMLVNVWSPNVSDNGGDIAVEV